MLPKDLGNERERKKSDKGSERENMIGTLKIKLLKIILKAVKNDCDCDCDRDCDCDYFYLLFIFLYSFFKSLQRHIFFIPCRMSPSP